MRRNGAGSAHESEEGITRSVQILVGENLDQNALVLDGIAVDIPPRQPNERRQVATGIENKTGVAPL